MTTDNLTNEPNDDREAREREVDEMILRGRRMDTTVPDAREHLHAKCDCVPDLGPAHCHLCTGEGSPVPWAECEAVAMPDAARYALEEEISYLRLVALKSDPLCSHITGKNEIKAAYARSGELAAERDAALAAIDRVRRAAEGPHPANSGLDSFTLAHVLAALDGAPEPEVKR